MEYISKPALIPDIANNFNLEEMSWEFLNSCDNSNFIFATADHPNPHLLPIRPTSDRDSHMHGGSTSKSSPSCSDASIIPTRPPMEQVPYVIGPDPSQECLSETARSILQRRTQNRVAQRTYRLRREEERKELRRKLDDAEKESLELRETCNELIVVISELRKQITRLERDNLSLRVIKSHNHKESVDQHRGRVILPI
ncbi:hypothetical protein V8E54_007925 [Elaphomyces granulatus]